MKRYAILLAFAIAAVLVFAPAAFANFAIHGGYTADTDACAGCHRAHTSISSVTWADSAGNDHSALLVSSASQIYEFCYACHDNAAQGADTNVEGGVYKGTEYGSHDATLNGGFFGYVSSTGAARTSDHVIAQGWGAYGGGTTGQDAIGVTTGTGNRIEMTCASCHDPHGSSNYRLLKDSVYEGVAVGGYTVDDTPTPFVISNEVGYPNGTGGRRMGWLKHQEGHDQIDAYKPNYTTPQYAKAPADNPAKGMSAWCAGCHTQYVNTGAPHGAVATYDAADGWGLAERHRHPMNVSLDRGLDNVANAGLTVTLTPVAQLPLPVASEPQNVASGTLATKAQSDWLDCMTCHVAHGTSVTMAGFANVKSVVTDPDAPGYTGDALTPDSGSGGVPPASDSALLRMDNRGVCEVCHNK